MGELSARLSLLSSSWSLSSGRARSSPMFVLQSLLSSSSSLLLLLLLFVACCSGCCCLGALRALLPTTATRARPLHRRSGSWVHLTANKARSCSTVGSTLSIHTKNKCNCRASRGDNIECHIVGQTARRSHKISQGLKVAILTDRDTPRQTDRHRDRHKQTERQKDTNKQTHLDTDRQRDAGSDKVGQKPTHSVDVCLNKDTKHLLNVMQ